MSERSERRVNVHQEIMADGHKITVGSSSSEIVAKMPPPGSKLLFQMGSVEIFIGEVKKFLRGELNSLG